MPDQYVTDTHALLWHIVKDSALSKVAAECFRRADGGECRILVPSICLVEMRFLVEKNRIPKTLLDGLIPLLVVQGGSYQVMPLDLGTYEAVGQVPREAVPDLPDRVILATAVQLSLPLITKDAKIHETKLVPLIWW